MGRFGVVGPAGRERAIALLTLAFSSDPVMRWGWPDPRTYLEHWPPVADAFGGEAFAHGTAYGLQNCAAVALWLPPGVSPPGEMVLGFMRAGMDDETFADYSSVFDQMDAHHPNDDHWYLTLMGVDPALQGRGLGAALLGLALEICDRDRLPAYLEATSPRSRDLYLRHGFEVAGTIQAGTSPPLWPMLREPAPQGTRSRPLT